MKNRILKNKPLVEAILELRWALLTPAPKIQIDPHYKLLLGRFSERLADQYPEHEQLANAIIPDEMSAYMVQHRFRYAPNDWPLVQVGPGIMTLNDTHKYVWEDFRLRALNAVEKLHEAHPKSNELKIESLLLRYVDAVEFDYQTHNLLDFLQNKLKVTVNLPPNLFESDAISAIPVQFSWQTTFRCNNPCGSVIVRFATGEKEGRPVLLWETMVHTTGSDIPSLPEKFNLWIDQAHQITDDWFFKLIEGELERRFSGE
jgi:uncharacterized protein (TIGR04255 family)